ncbi:alpha-mannosidase [[Candida] anglica]|uniref:alpha-mannosidase n=1 Tax=[Candida] anglica TaxID=148631 RepID=A0ABP0E6C0_9ASCO
MVNSASSEPGYAQFSLQPNFKPVDSLFENRLRQFIDNGGQYRELNLPHFYDKDRVDTNTEYINIKVYPVPDIDGKTQRPLFKDINFKKIDWDDANKGYSFGPSWKTFWFKVEWEIPEKWLTEKGNGKDEQEIHFEWDCGNEGLLYTSDGLPLQAFSGGGERIRYNIPKEYRIKGKQLFYLETACNGMFGVGDQGNPDPNRYFGLDKCDLVLPNVTARKLYYDFWIISDAAREFSGQQWQKWTANSICNEIMDTFDPEDVKSLDKCREISKRYLGKDIDSDDVFHVETFKGRIDVFGVGNCHIDTAWLWPFAETKRKIVRSWTTQLKIADEYPEYIFVASQMQQFKWLKEYHPEILKLVHEKFAANQFLPIGGSWVENDTNLPNGESLIRQFVLGQNFQLNEFGVKADIFWLPDTFGYSSQIPQICQTVGIEKFVTQKLSWNNINQFPLSTFNWVGIDGSQVLVHMPPANTYTADANFGDVVRSQQQHKNLRDVPTGLLLYGKGDGGGGPTEEMLEKLRRCRGIANENGLMPTLQLGVTVEDFFDDVLAKSKQGSSLPSWVGEIYLEFHRGTYTTQADIKKYMRKGEIKLHDLEWIATLLSLQEKFDYKYPKKELQALWEDLCLCQFHDVLPGSCIGMVYYEEAKPMLRKLLSKADDLIKEALKALKVGSESNQTSTGLDNLAFLNTLPWTRHEVVKLTKDQVPELFTYGELDSNYSGYAIQKLNDSVLISVNVGADDVKINKLSDIKYHASVKDNKDGTFILSNELIKATITKNGVITSLFDTVNKREVIDTRLTKQTGTGKDSSVVGGNQFVLFDDEPLNFPAWDTELYSLNKFKFLTGGEISIAESGPLKSSLIVKHSISEKSYIKTEISIEGLLDATFTQNNYVKFVSDVTWHETYKFLKVQFPTTIHTAQQANYETQFGITQRPTHFNTSWDVAKFEVCHHKFMDLSEFNYGVSILNDSKYGGAIHGNLIRLSLLRSPKAPDEKADMGDHHFEYAIYPHKHYLGSDTVKLGYNFNHKLEHHTLKSDDLTSFGKLISLESESESLILSQIKRSEHDEDLLIYDNLEAKNKGHKSFVIRVYEALGGYSSGTLKVDLNKLQVTTVYKTNSLEEEDSEIEINKDGEVEIELRGFEIATYKFVLK